MNLPRYNLQTIEQSLQRKSWWAMLFVLPIARRLSRFIINHTKLTPNAVTLFSFLFVPLAAWAYSRGTYAGLIAGAVLFEINYLFDCVDGTIARVKGLVSPLGAYLDPKLDRLRVVILAFALAYGQMQSGGGFHVLLALLLYLGVNNLIMLTRAAQERVLISHGFSSKLGADLVISASNQGILARWLRLAQQRNFMPYYHDVELDALVFVLGAIFNHILLFTVVAICLGLILIFLMDALFIRSLMNLPRSNEP